MVNKDLKYLCSGRGQIICLLDQWSNPKSCLGFWIRCSNEEMRLSKVKSAVYVRPDGNQTRIRKGKSNKGKGTTCTTELIVIVLCLLFFWFLLGMAIIALGSLIPDESSHSTPNNLKRNSKPRIICGYSPQDILLLNRNNSLAGNKSR
jgi:hypothetical protein